VSLTTKNITKLFARFSVGSRVLLSLPLVCALPAAGIAVVMSAGNRGPNPSTVDNPFPYATIVAASTHSRKIVATVLADGKRYVGGGFYATTVGPARLILGNAAAMPGVKGEDAQKCFNGTLDPRKVAGAIVVRRLKAAKHESTSHQGMSTKPPFA
jgi:subtilisin family serine protease